MEFFNKAKAVRLKSHLGKYLTADDDQQTVHQSKNGSSRKARWTVEFVQGNPHVIRLKGCHGRYLTASDEAFLLGMTGKKVVQSVPNGKKDGSIEWEPIKEGFRVQLRTKGGKFLRANGATPPWRNSITHDLPHRTATQDWIMWEVDMVDISVLDDQHLPSNASSFSSIHDDYISSNSPSFSSIHDDYIGSNSPSISSVNRREISMLEQRKSPMTSFAQNQWLSIASDRSSYKSRTQDGMEFFHKAKAVRLQSHLGKYLLADDDEQTVRQSRNGASRRARWTVEFIDGKVNRIRLKSYHGLYLTKSDEPFLLGMTGKKVLQTLPEKLTDVRIEWEPVKEGINVKLMTNDGNFLRANGGTPPWRNSVTHDVPHRTATQDWIMWGVDIVDIQVMDSDPDADVDSGRLSPVSSFNDDSLVEDFAGSSDMGFPFMWYDRPFRRILDSNSEKIRSKNLRCSRLSENFSSKQVSGMDLFKKAKTVRLRSHHDKYLIAYDDQEAVVQGRSGSSKGAKWTVEFVEETGHVLRLKSCYGLYLTAADEEFLLGVTGRKVVQSRPRKLDSSIEWEPIRDGMQVKLKSRYGNYLRANGGLPPWRNSITHDIPHRHHAWILWEVDVVEIRPESPPKVVERSDSSEEDSSDEDVSLDSLKIRSPALQSRGSYGDSPKKSEGRLIYYQVADDDGNVNDDIEGKSFQFIGHGLEELTQKLEEETDLQDFIVCSRNRVNGKLYPLRLALPPNNATMHVVIVPATSTAANEFMPAVPPSPPSPS